MAVAAGSGCMYEIQLADNTVCCQSAYGGPAFSHLVGRMAYTQSDCSSSLSSLSVVSSSRVKAGRRPWMAGGRRTQAMTFLAAALGTGVVGAHGLFQALYQEMFADSPQAVALVGAVQLGCFIALRPVAAWASARHGRPVVLAAGAVMASGGMLAAGFAAQIWQLCLAQGVLVGAGACACETAGFSSDPRARDLAQWAVAGGGIGAAVLALAAAGLAQSLGLAALALRWLALAVCVAQLAVLALLGRAPNGRAVAASGKLGDYTQPRVTTSAIRGRPRAFVREAWIRIVQWQRRRPGCILSAAGSVLHSVGAPLPLLYLPSYAALRLPSGTRPLVCVVPLVLLCMASAVGAPLAHALLTRHSLRPVLLLGATRAALSLAMWCMWLPAGTSWPVISVFALFYGLMLGAAGYTQSQDPESATPPVLLPVAGSAAMAGAAAAAWLVATPDQSPLFMPLIAFAAAAMLAAAVATTVAGTVCRRRSRRSSTSSSTGKLAAVAPVTWAGW